MRQSTNVYQNTLKTYYNIIVAYYRMKHNGRQIVDDFLENCYDSAKLEFEDEQKYHSANEYVSPEALVIIYTGERLSLYVSDNMSEEAWNNMLEVSYNFKEIK